MRVALIPARGGSQRVPFKNGLQFRGRAMLTYPIATARESGLFDLIVVSTDDCRLADIAFTNGAIVIPRFHDEHNFRKRDDGTTGTQEIAARVLDQLDLTGSCCVIYPCTPLLTPDDLKAGWTSLLTPAAKPFTRLVGPDGKDAGAAYWGWTRAFRDRKPLDQFNTVDVCLPAERCIDIDTPEDMARAEAMFDALRRSA